MEDKNIKLLDIKIDSKETLLKALDYLHDGNVKEENIIYNESEQSLDIYIDREYFEDESFYKIERKFLFIAKVKYPLMRTQLHLSRIKSFRKKRSDKFIKNHTFDECIVKDSAYILKFKEVLKIELFFEGDLSGFLKDIKFSGEQSWFTVYWPPWDSLKKEKRKQK